MKIELKKIKVCASLSHETNAYTAEIWIDDVKRGTVENSGQGGPDEVYPWELAKEINEYAATLPKINAYGVELTQDVDLIFGDIVEKHLFSKKLQRMLKSKTVLVKGNELYTCKNPPTIKQQEDYVVLNKLSFEDAMTYFLKCVK